MTMLVITQIQTFSLAGFFAYKVEHESKTNTGRSFQRTGTLAFERVYTAK